MPNHTSDEHEWFIKSVARDPEYKDYYIWHDGSQNPEGGQNLPPNNWVSVFYGSAWTWNDKRQQYYFHQFTKQQPDLNFRHPAVGERMKDILRFWMAKGVAGFRCDAVRQWRKWLSMWSAKRYPLLPIPRWITCLRLKTCATNRFRLTTQTLSPTDISNIITQKIWYSSTSVASHGFLMMSIYAAGGVRRYLFVAWSPWRLEEDARRWYENTLDRSLRQSDVHDAILSVGWWTQKRLAHPLQLFNDFRSEQRLVGARLRSHNQQVDELYACRRNSELGCESRSCSLSRKVVSFSR